MLFGVSQDQINKQGTKIGNLQTRLLKVETNPRYPMTPAVACCILG